MRNFNYMFTKNQTLCFKLRLSVKDNTALVISEDHIQAVLFNGNITSSKAKVSQIIKLIFCFKSMKSGF